MSKYNYTNPFSYKLIYIFRINDDQHSGILKVGDTSIDYAGSPDDLTPSCELLNKAAKERINQYENRRHKIRTPVYRTRFLQR